MLAKVSIKSITFAATALLISACGDQAIENQPNQTASQPTIAHSTTQTSKAQKSATIQPISTAEIDIASLIFTDAKLANCVIQQAEKQQWRQVKQIKKLNCANKGIENLGGLQNLTQLQQLDLSQNQIAILAPLKPLIQLKQLNLAGNNIVDIAPLASLSKLIQLDLGPATKLNRNSNSIRDLAAIANLTALQKLDVSYNQISDISMLESLTNLMTLQLSHNQIRDIAHLQAFNHSNQIDLRGNDNITCAALNELDTSLYQGKLQRPSDCLFTLDILIVDLNIDDQQLKSCLLDTASAEGWIAISEVTTLSCEQYGIKTLAGIDNLKALTQLDLSSNQITDISPLIALNTAQINLVHNNQIACTRLDALQASLGQHAIERPQQCAQLSQLSDVNFSDIAIESCVTYTAELYQWQTIDEMTSLHCPSELDVKISHLSDLQQLTALNSVHISTHLSKTINCDSLEHSQRQLSFFIEKPQHCL